MTENILITWAIVGFAGGLAWTSGSYTWNSVFARLFFGTILGPFSFAIKLWKE